MTIKLTDIKAALITKVKATTTVTSLLVDPLEVRELEWQGTKFSYPNVRVRVQSFKRHTPNSGCDLFDVVASVCVFGDDASSKLTDRVADEIFAILDTKTVTQAPVKIIGIKAEQFGAMWIEESGAWQSEIKLDFQAS